MICSPTTKQNDGGPGQQGPEHTSSENGPKTAKGKRVLIADDSLVFLGALSMKLRNHGYEVVVCHECARIISMARNERPDLILLDLNFPPDSARGGEENWDGLLVLDWLRRLEETKDTPVMVITGEDPARYKELSYATGAVGFFEKPIRPDELLPAIRLALGGGAAGRASLG